MKAVYLSLFILLNFSAFSEPKEVPQRTFKIIVINNLTADENFQLVGRTLIDNDYQIEIKDKDFYTIKTDPKDVYLRRAGTFYLNFAIKDKSIAITGKILEISKEFFSGFETDHHSQPQICYQGIDGSQMKDSFLKMAEFAKKLGTEFEFEVMPLGQ